MIYFWFISLSYKYLNLPGSNIQKAISLVASKVRELLSCRIMLRNLCFGIQEIDGIGSGFVPTLDRLEKMDFAHFVWFEPYTMIVPRPGEEPRLFAFIAPFQPQVIRSWRVYYQFYINHTFKTQLLKVWLLISVAVFVVVCSMTCFAEIYFNNSKQFENGRTLLGKREKFSKFDSATINAVYVAKTITNQGRSLDSSNPLTFSKRRNHSLYLGKQEEENPRVVCLFDFLSEFGCWLRWFQLTVTQAQ